MPIGIQGKLFALVVAVASSCGACSGASGESVDVMCECVDLAEQLVEFDLQVEVPDMDADSGGGQDVGRVAK
ncbi:hypothetical protein [Amycolatopsis sp. lyj-112]|uniref:hypothetical protein n=1 Tax=Amycolatopsis sp. lyj-112 TaxID=2789288 RepID=UPI00397DF9A0